MSKGVYDTPFGTLGLSHLLNVGNVFDELHCSDMMPTQCADIEAIVYSRIFTNLIIGLLSLWAIYSILSTAFGVFVVFPLRAVDSTGVPDGRLQSIRLAVLATFAFYGIMHLIQGSKEVYPIHFLKSFLFFLGTMGGLLEFENF